MAEGKEPRSSKRMTDLIGQVLQINKLIDNLYLKQIDFENLKRIKASQKSQKAFQYRPILVVMECLGTRTYIKSF